MKRITDPTFRYTPAAQTDIRKSRMKWLREYAKAFDEAHAENAARDARRATVTEIKRKGAK